MRPMLCQASDAGAAFIACTELVCELPLYEWRDGPDGVGYYRHAAAPPGADPREQSLLVLREAAAAGADFVRCPEEVGVVAGYDFRDGADGVGYYRRPDAPLPDAREYMRSVLQRACAAGATFIGCPEEVQPLVGYVTRLSPCSAVSHQMHRMGNVVTGTPSATGLTGAATTARPIRRRPGSPGTAP